MLPLPLPARTGDRHVDARLTRTSTSRTVTARSTRQRANIDIEEPAASTTLALASGISSSSAMQSAVSGIARDDRSVLPAAGTSLLDPILLLSSSTTDGQSESAVLQEIRPRGECPRVRAHDVSDPPSDATTCTVEIDALEEIPSDGPAGPPVDLLDNPPPLEAAAQPFEDQEDGLDTGV